jgi:EAL domain-containing protein (putative c-di-GMP-specific phosphodiesterase class I)
MLAQADLALYRSKEEGRNRYRFHSDDLDHQVLERVALSDDLRSAIENDELELYYQPQVELRSGRIVGMEAYVRWHHPERGLLAAREFVPVAEKTGSIIPLGQWVLDQACAQMRAWRDAGVNPPAVTMNLSLAQLKNSKELIKDVRAGLDRWQLEPSDLNFDVTEAMLAQVTLMRNDVLTELRRIGVGLSIDDFGSEYSSLDYLRTYHVNHLKITSEFMDGATEDPDRATTVRAIVNLARELGIGVVTEGVETEDHLDVSNSTSIIAQGVYFSEALDAAHAQALLRQGIIEARDEPVADASADATVRTMPMRVDSRR